MTIKFNCQQCRKEIQAPDAAGGKRGKCPYCATSNYVPMPVAEDDTIPLAPVDEQDELQRQKEIEELLRQERALLAETGEEPSERGAESDAGGATDLRQLVVEYCLDMHKGKLPKAQATAAALKKNPSAALRLVGDFMSGREIEPGLATMPGALLQGFLRQLRGQLQ